MIKRLIDKLLGKPAAKSAATASAPPPPAPPVPRIPLGKRVEVPASEHGIDPALVDERAIKVVHTLKEAVAFYAQRDTNPEKWYPRNHDGTVAKFNDLPAKYRGNVEREAPFGRKPGDAPALSDEEIEDVVAFLKTLSDGFRPSD